MYSTTSGRAHGLLHGIVLLFIPYTYYIIHCTERAKEHENEEGIHHLFLFAVLARMLALSETTESTLVLCDRIDSLRALTHSLLASSASLEPSPNNFSSAGRPYRDLIALSAASFALSTFFSSLNLLRALTEAAYGSSLYLSDKPCISSNRGAWTFIR